MGISWEEDVFKIGDKVRVLDGHHPSIHEGTVIDIIHDSRKVPKYTVCSGNGELYSEVVMRETGKQNDVGYFNDFQMVPSYNPPKESLLNLIDTNVQMGSDEELVEVRGASRVVIRDELGYVQVELKLKPGYMEIYWDDEYESEEGE